MLNARLSHNLPLELNSFIGREREIAKVEELLAGGARLLTLCGPGGCGKTRLALAVAAKAAEDFEDGAWWVGLASLSDPELVPQAVAQALKVPEHPGLSLNDALIEGLREKRLLLVLDNCEHLIEACAGFARTMLVSCPGLQVLATSREALGIAGEVNWRVPSLAVPDEGYLPSVEGVARCEAVALFAERARSRLPSFGLSNENAGAVAEVCRKLDGIPLAIELAAARVSMLSVEQISERLKDPLGFLTAGDRTTAPRQRTLRSTLAWSYEMLEETERRLFGRLSVFAGGWTLEAAEAVGEGNGIERYEALDLLSGLVDKSLVVAEASGEEEGTLRYRMLEPVRQYARERLEESGEADSVRHQHAAWFLALAEEAEPELKGARREAWLERLETEHDNVRAALSWALEGGDAELGLRLAGAIGGFWLMRSHLIEGRRWLEAGLAGSGTSPTASARAKALARAGSVALWQNDLEAAVALLEEGLGLYEELNDEPGIAASLTDLGHAVLHQEEDEEGRLKALYARAEALRWEFTDRWAIAQLLFFLGMVALYEGDPQGARVLLGQSLFSFRELGDTGGVYLCRTYLWMAALERGDLDRAAGLLEKDLRQLQKLAIKPQLQILDDLLGSAVVAALRGQPARTARLWAAAETLREVIGVPLPLWEHVPTDPEAHLIAARSQIEEAAWEVAWAQGRAMTPEQAINYALGEALPVQEPAPRAATAQASRRPAPRATRGQPLPEPLTERELEVLGLMAEGLSNQQIATQLFIAVSTVKSYVNRIFGKLDVQSRTSAVAMARRLGLVSEE